MNPTAEQKFNTAAFLRDFKLQEQLRALEEVDEREDRINTVIPHPPRHNPDIAPESSR